MSIAHLSDEQLIECLETAYTYPYYTIEVMQEAARRLRSLTRERERAASEDDE